MIHRTVQSVRRVRLAACTALAALSVFAASVEAVPLPPGGVVPLSGSVGRPGVVVSDGGIPFSIPDGSGRVVTGNVQNRVVRHADGTLSFSPRIRDVGGTSAFGIVRVIHEGFAGFATDVDYCVSCLGDVGPTLCGRSGDGDDLDYSFAFAPVFRGSSSRFFGPETDATQFDPTGGRFTIVLENGFRTTINIAAPVIDTTPPEVRITSPAPESCVCPSFVTPIEVVVCDDESDLSWTVRARRSRDADGTGWTIISTGTIELCSPFTLTTWDTRGLSGEYILEVEAINEVGLVTTAALEVRIDASVAPASLRTPVDGTIVGGNTCFDGTISQDCGGQYTVGYRPAGSGGGFVPVDPDSPVYFGGVINEPFAFWDTRSLADAKYEVRIRTENPCGDTADVSVVYEVDNTPPIAVVTNIEPCEWVGGVVPVRGEIFDKNIGGWVLEYTGGGSRRWNTIATGSGNIPAGGLIANWDTRSLQRCAYTLRLRASDTARRGCIAPSGNSTHDLLSVSVGCEADFDGDGELTIFDFLAFQTAFSAGCP
ncbi:MAG: hypothetical protein AAFX79_09970 [Planctomycetota bacterium]